MDIDTLIAYIGRHLNPDRASHSVPTYAELEQHCNSRLFTQAFTTMLDMGWVEWTGGAYADGGRLTLTTEGTAELLK